MSSLSLLQRTSLDIDTPLSVLSTGTKVSTVAKATSFYINYEFRVLYLFTYLYIFYRQVLENKKVAEGHLQNGDDDGTGNLPTCMLFVRKMLTI